MARKPATSSRIDRVEIPVRAVMPLGYLGIKPVTGRSWDEELVEALKAMGAERDEQLVVTLSRMKRGTG